MNPGVFQDDENADHQDDVAYDLRDGVLQRPIKSAVGEESREKKTLRARGNPENDDEQRDEQKNLNETQGHSRQWRTPLQRNAGRIDRRDREKYEGDQTQDRRNDRDEFIVDLEAGEDTPHDFALQCPGHQHAEREPGDKRDDTEKRDVVTRDLKQRPLQQR